MSRGKDSTRAPAHTEDELASIIVNEMFQLVGILDSQGINLQSNRTSLEAAGLSREEVIGQPFWQTPWWPPETRDEVKAAVERAARGEFVRYEVGINGRPGEDRLYLDFSLKPVLDAAGAVQYIIAEGRDITAKKHAEALLERKTVELRDLYDELRRLDRLKNQFFANVSHELRTPLALIMGLAERLRMGTEDAAKARTGEQIAGHARALLAQVNGLLDFAKLDEGKVTLEYSRTDLAALVRRVASSFETVAADRGLTLAVNTPERLDVVVDALKVERILVNLIANAFKFTRSGGVRCALVVERGRAVLRVADSGMGVATEHRDAIFERFFQVDGGSTRRFGGVGLGLALVRDLAELHGGSARVGDAAEGGAEFTVELLLEPKGSWEAGPSVAEHTLPLSARVAAVPVSPTRDFAHAPPEDGRALVLLLEDNADMQQFIAEVLAEHYRVVTAADGREGLEKAIASRPELILTDVMMPNMSGDEFLRAVLAVPLLSGVPVIVLTAKADEDLRVQLLRSGAKDFLTKPVAPAELLARVGNLVDMRRTRLVLERELEGRSGTLEELARELGDRKRDLGAALEALRRTEEQLRQTQKMEAIGNLTAGIAHDFNNLLTVILSYCALLEVDIGRLPGVQESVKAIEEAGLRAARLTGQLLAFSRQQVMSPSVLNLNEVISKLYAMLSRLIGANIEIELALDADLGTVKVDASQIEQVIMNLAVNARDAMPDGGTLTIATQNVTRTNRGAGDDEPCHASHAPHVLMTVTDSGAGMDAATQRRIFEPFFTTKEIGKGTGLGLATVFGIVKQSGGDVDVVSEVGRGSTFFVYLPQSREALQPEKIADVSESRGSQTILLVEDHDQVRALVRRVLERGGYLVLEASSGDDALRLSERFAGDIHLLLTDVVMPRMSGPELARQLIAARPDTKVLFMSGYTNETVVHHGLVDQTLSFIQKPVTPESLTRKVHETLEAPCQPFRR